MSTIKITSPYVPNSAPQQTSDQMRDYLREEIDFIAESLNASHLAVDELRAIPHMFLSGDTDDVDMTVAGSKFVNYSQSAALGIVPIEPDPAAGDITIPKTGTYRLTAYFFGSESSS